MNTLVQTDNLPLTGLPGEAYTDPDWFGREQVNIFRPRWLYACHLSQVAEPGAFFRWDRDDYSLLIVRGEDGTVRALHNVCRHRGARIEQRETGVCKAAFVCPYHGWAYGADGALRGAPRMHDDFDKSTVRLAEAHVDVWNGIVFVCLAAERPSPVAIELEGVDLAVYQLDKAKVIADREHVVEANWKVLWENGLECYHCALNHPELKHVVEVIRNGPQPTHLESGEWDFRPDFQILPTSKSVTIDGAIHNKRLLGADGNPPQAVGFLQWHTTLTEIVAAPDHAALMLYRPIDPTHTGVRMVAIVNQDAEEGKDFEVDELTELHRVVRGQDDTLCEQVQEGLSSKAFVPGPYNRGYEFMLQNFVRVYNDALAGRI